ncbi:MAG TPA: hypothetical protein VFS05_04225 [Gemmatimonadaceae bacterium]|nr:hypothetical protein [Gemmatimonadaceae bacterium]
MIPEPLPKEVRELIALHLATMEHVEILLLLARDAARAWTAPAAAAELRGSIASTTAKLEALAAAGLAARDKQAEGTLYRYVPSTAALRSAVSSLADVYRLRPVTLVRAIYDRPPPAVKSFADAFDPEGLEED